MSIDSIAVAIWVEIGMVLGKILKKVADGETVLVDEEERAKVRDSTPLFVGAPHAFTSTLRLSHVGSSPANSLSCLFTK